MEQTWIRVGNKSVTRLVVFGKEGEETLLGANTLEGLLLTVNPVDGRLVYTPGPMMPSVCNGQPVQDKVWIYEG